MKEPLTTSLSSFFSPFFFLDSSSVELALMYETISISFFASLHFFFFRIRFLLLLLSLSFFFSPPPPCLRQHSSAIVFVLLFFLHIFFSFIFELSQSRNVRI